MIGIIDQDMMYNPKSANPSLELMKISAYYKSKQNIVRLIDNFLPESINSYERIFLRKDSLQNMNFMNNIMSNSNVKLIGDAFTGEELPLEMERKKPDYDLYLPLYRYLIFKDLVEPKRIKTLLNTDYVKFFYNGELYKNSLEDYLTDGKNRIFIMDKDFFKNPNWTKIMPYVAKRNHHIDYCVLEMGEEVEIFKQQLTPLYGSLGGAGYGRVNHIGINAKTEEDYNKYAALVNDNDIICFNAVNFKLPKSKTAIEERLGKRAIEVLKMHNNAAKDGKMMRFMCDKIPIESPYAKFLSLACSYTLFEKNTHISFSTYLKTAMKDKPTDKVFDVYNWLCFYRRKEVGDTFTVIPRP